MYIGDGTVKLSQVTVAIIMVDVQFMCQRKHPVHNDEYSYHDSWQAYFIEGIDLLQNSGQKFK